MARYGINVKKAGPTRFVAVVAANPWRPRARRALVGVGIHDAKIWLPCGRSHKSRKSRWSAGRDFDSWDGSTSAATGCRGRSAPRKTGSGRGGRSIKRAGFVMIACLAVHDKAAKDVSRLLQTDQRGATWAQLREAVNWALRSSRCVRAKFKPSLPSPRVDRCRCPARTARPYTETQPLQLSTTPEE
jgi:hypothetical protein